MGDDDTTREQIKEDLKRAEVAALMQRFLDKKPFTAKETTMLTETLLKRTDLSAAQKLMLVHINQDNRLSILKQIQKHTLEHLFKVKPDKFFKSTFHYDWWMFPMHVPPEWNWQERNYDASLTSSEAEILLFDDEFVNNYIEGVSLYLHALETHGWNDYAVRYARMLCSLNLFLSTASNMDDRETVYDRLYEAGVLAIDFEENNELVKKYPEYNLLYDGVNQMKIELARFDDLTQQNSFKIK